MDDYIGTCPYCKLTLSFRSWIGMAKHIRKAHDMPLRLASEIAKELPPQSPKRDAVREYDTNEVYEVRVQTDQKVYVRGTIEEIVRTAFREGYERGRADMLHGDTK